MYPLVALSFNSHIDTQNGEAQEYAKDIKTLWARILCDTPIFLSNGPQLTPRLSRAASEMLKPKLSKHRIMSGFSKCLFSTQRLPFCIFLLWEGVDGVAQMEEGCPTTDKLESIC